MNLSRRNFLRNTACAGAVTLAGFLPAAEDRVLLRAGILTDTHFGAVKEGVGRFRMAWQLFKRQGCQLVAHLGDIADHYYPEWYAKVCDVRAELFGDPSVAPKEVWVDAGHDWIDMPGGRGSTGYGDYRLLKDALAIRHEAYDSFSLAGFEFVVCPQTDNYPKMKELLDGAFARTKPGNPVFLFDHSAGYDTTEGSHVSGIIGKRKFLSNYPQLIHITGHSHGSLYNEKNIHQGEYTTVSAGCLTYFGTPGIGIPRSESGNGENYSALVMELHAQYAVFHRYSISSGEEIGGDDPWVVAWPFDPKTAKYSPANQRKRHPVPDFAAGTRLRVAVEKGKTGNLVGDGEHLAVKFPAVDSRFVHYYRVEAFRRNAHGEREQILLRDVRGEYWKEPERRSSELTHNLDAAFFAPGEQIEVTVRPVDFWGRTGSPIGWKGTAPTDSCKVIWRGDARKIDDFRYELTELPEEIIGKDVKVVVDVETESDAPGGVFFGLATGKRWWVDTCVTPVGRSRLTYVLRLKTGRMSAGQCVGFGFNMLDGHGDGYPFSIKFTNIRMMA